MKFLHCADLHLGRSLLEESLVEDQRKVLEDIIQIVTDKRIDAVLICGDIYDKSIPSVEAVRMFSNFLTELYHLNIKVFIISGNHDSKDRLNFGNELFIDNGIYIEGVFKGKLEFVTLHDDNGDVNVYMLPFVRPADVRAFYPDIEIESYNDAIHCIIEHADIDVDKRNIIMVHQFVTGTGMEVLRSESETFSLGGIDNVDVLNFSMFDYVAMGHVHGAQKLSRDTVRYSGSPLKYSFSEVFQKKSVVVVDFSSKDDISVELVPLKSLHGMRKIRGKFSDLISEDVVSSGDVNDYLYVVLTDDDYVVDAISRLKAVYPNVLRLEYDNTRTSGDNSGYVDILVDVSKKSEMDIFKDFYYQQNHVELDSERENIVNSIIKDIKDID